MSNICPVCNGLMYLKAYCNNCNHSLDDYGRIDQIWEPYSPYREIDDIKLTNGFDDYATHQCIHLTNCPACGNNQIVAINEKVEP